MPLLGTVSMFFTTKMQQKFTLLECTALNIVHAVLCQSTLAVARNVVEAVLPHVKIEFLPVFPYPFSKPPIPHAVLSCYVAGENVEEMKLQTTAIFTLRAWLRDIQLGVRVVSSTILGGALATQVADCPWFRGIAQFHAVTGTTCQ